MLDRRSPGAVSVTRGRTDKCLPPRPPMTYRPSEVFVALSCAQSFGILPRLTRRDADCVWPEPGAHPLLGHDRAVACAGRSFPRIEPDGGPGR
jgi:hypothetical protein